MATHARANRISPHAIRVAAIIAAAIAAAAALVFIGVKLGQPGHDLPTQATSQPESLPPATTQPTTTNTTPSSTQPSEPEQPHLSLSSPTAKTVTVTSPSLAIMGSANPQQPLTMNGQAITVTENGGFAVDVTLQPGQNVFRFVSGKENHTLTVTYKVVVLQSVTPASALTLDGGSSVQFRAVARKGSTVKIKFNGQTKTMTVIDTQDEEAGDRSNDFVTYQAALTMPAAKAGEAQKLGAATVTATYNGLSESRKSGAVTIKPGTSSDFIIVTRDYAETFSGSTVNDFSRPTNAYLPAGTVDSIIKTGTVDDKSYYLLGCGRWIYQDDAERIDTVKKLTETPLAGGDVRVTEETTLLTLDAAWKIPYNLLLAPQSYAAPNASTPDYAITRQTTQYIDITFYYTKSVPAAPDMSRSPLFSSAAWRTVDGNPVLRLNLRHTGQFYGYSVVWKGSQLCFSFRHPSGTAQNSVARPLEGIRIVVDPGHGGTSSGTYGTIKGLYEKTMTLRYSLALRDKLQSLGATVDMTRTTDVLPDDPTMATRTAHARNNGTDLLLSIHMNGSTFSSANGCTLHYFNEYSRDIAGLLTEEMRAVETKHGIGNREFVTIWSPFFLARVHDCPAVLVECGFMTNAKNMEALNSSAYQKQMVDAISNAVVRYFASLPRYTVFDNTTESSATDPATESSDDSTVTEPTEPPTDNGQQPE